MIYLYYIVNLPFGIFEFLQIQIHFSCGQFGSIYYNSNQTPEKRVRGYVEWLLRLMFHELCLSHFGYFLLKQLQNLKGGIIKRFNYITGNHIVQYKYPRSPCLTCAHVKIVDFCKKKISSDNVLIFAFWYHQAYFCWHYVIIYAKRY